MNGLVIDLLVDLFSKFRPWVGCFAEGCWRGVGGVRRGVITRGREAGLGPVGGVWEGALAWGPVWGPISVIVPGEGRFCRGCF